MSDAKKIRTQPLPWELPGAHYIDDQERDMVNTVIEAASPFRYYGPKLQHCVDRLEAAFSQKFNVPHALAVNSGTAALHIIFSSLAIGPGDEVLIPGYLWVSCISAVIRVGAIPRLVDIDDTFCMCPQDLECKINDRTKAILYVHMSGAPGYIDKVAAIAKRRHLFLIEDCAQALNSQYKGQYTGSFGDAAIFSFQLNKNMTSGEGGMILCKDKALYDRCFAIHDLGYARNDEGRLDTHNEHIQLWGIGARMSEITAAFALAQFSKLDTITQHMNRSKWKIRKALENIDGLYFRNIPDPKGDSGPFLICSFDKQQICKEFVATLKACGIEGPKGSLSCLTMEQWGLHWYFNNMSLVNKRSNACDGFPWSHEKNQFSAQINYQRGTLTMCDSLAERSMLLAIASNLNDNDCNDIIAAFKFAVTECIVNK